MAVLTVTTSVDVVANDGLVSLREAIEAANSGDVITFGTALFGQSIRLGSVLTVGTGENFTIQGDIDRNGTADITIDGGNATRLMNVQSGATLALDTIIMANGRDTGAAGGAGGAGGPGGDGGAGGNGGNGVAGILNDGALTLTRVLFSGNTATGGTGGDGGNGGSGGAGSPDGSLFGTAGDGGPGGEGGDGGAGGLAASAVLNSAGARLTLIDSAWVNQTVNYGEGGKGGNGGAGGAGGGAPLGFGGNGGRGGAGGDEGAQGSGGVIVNFGIMNVTGAVAGSNSIINVGTGRGAGLGGAGGALGIGAAPGRPGANGSAGNEAPTAVLQPDIFSTGAGTLTGFSNLSSSLVYLAAPTLSQAEGSGGGVTNYTFTLVRLGDTSAAAAVAFSVAGGTADSFDFTAGATNGTANFAAGQSSTTFTVGVVQDEVIEADETFTVSIASSSPGLTVGAGSNLTATIVNDDVSETFVFTRLRPKQFIGDFDTGVDVIQLENRVFKGLGNSVLKKKNFVANEDGEATKKFAQIIYDTDSGKLFYDSDGTGRKKAVHFATLEGSPDLSRLDFDFI